jgi:hypothetical protein
MVRGRTPRRRRPSGLCARISPTARRRRASPNMDGRPEGGRCHATFRRASVVSANRERTCASSVRHARRSVIAGPALEARAMVRGRTPRRRRPSGLCARISPTARRRRASPNMDGRQSNERRVQLDAVLGRNEYRGNATARKSRRKAFDASRNAATNARHPPTNSARAARVDAKHSGIADRADICGRSNGDAERTCSAPTCGFARYFTGDFSARFWPA